MATCSDYIIFNVVVSAAAPLIIPPSANAGKLCATVLPPKSCVCVATPFRPERPAREPASKGHTGGGSRKNAKPAGPFLCTTVIKSDFCAQTIQVALRVVNKFNYNNVSRAGPTLKYFYV